MICMSIPYDRLQMMDTFIRIVEIGSISGAARDLRVAQSSVSRQLRQLEDSLGISLITRTTHQISRTDAGRGFLPECHRMIREWKGIEDHFRHDAVQPRGRLRIVASVGLGQFFLVEIAARYCRRYPEVEIEWNVDDGPVSVLQSGIDCLLKVGHIEEKSLVTQTVAEVRAMLVASPGLIAEMGMPSIPAELAGWPMIGVHPYFADSIAIRSHRGRASRVRGSRRFLTSNIVVARGGALAGAGFTLLADCLPAGLPKQIYYSTTYTTARRFSGAVRRGIGRPFGGFGIRART